MRNKKENDDVRNCACYMDIGVYNRSQCRVRKPARIHFIYIYIYRKKRKADFSAFRLMREMGLEPTRPIGHKILSLACLPISALPQTTRDGIEPTTSAVTGRRSNRLSHRATLYRALKTVYRSYIYSVDKTSNLPAHLLS